MLKLYFVKIPKKIYTIFSINMFVCVKIKNKFEIKDRMIRRVLNSRPRIRSLGGKMWKNLKNKWEQASGRVLFVRLAQLLAFELNGTTSRKNRKKIQVNEFECINRPVIRSELDKKRTISGYTRAIRRGLLGISRIYGTTSTDVIPVLFSEKSN